MIVLILLAFVGMLTGIFLILGMTPFTFAEELTKPLSGRRQPISKRIQQVNHPKEPKGIRKTVLEAREMLILTGKGGKFAAVCAFSLFLAAMGAVICIVIQNYFMLPVLAAGMGLLPFWYVLFTSHSYKKLMNNEIETGLSIITSSYLRSESMITAVEENIHYLNPPVADVFRGFLAETNMISADVKQALSNMKPKLDNYVFREWVDAAIACQDDKSLKSTLTPIIGKLSDMRIVAAELDYLLYEPFKEFITMAFLLIGNIPLLFPAYTGATNKTCSNDTIITYLGMGIVWFTDPPEQPEPTDYDYEYRVDTDVITPVTLYAGSEINPDSPATVSFTINGSTYRMNNIVIPSGDSQIAWVKWHTPSEPQDITIYVSTNKGSLSQSTIQAKVVDLSGNDPPDPKATDTMGSWTASSVPSRETKTYAAWSVWWARWHPYWVWHSTGDDDGYWVDEGWYDFFRDNYSASMTATTRIEPDEKVPTASGDLMKSGYGVTNTVTATVSTSAPLSHYTYGQTAVSYFPEFGYGTYWRLLERLTSGTTARFQFAKNIYSTYNQRVHFTPVWFPDGSYTVNTHVMDIWTPAGMLAMNLTDDVTISGSLYDDWHIAPGNP